VIKEEAIKLFWGFIIFVLIIFGLIIFKKGQKVDVV